MRRLRKEGATVLAAGRDEEDQGPGGLGEQAVEVAFVVGASERGRSEREVEIALTPEGAALRADDPIGTLAMNTPSRFWWTASG